VTAAAGLSRRIPRIPRIPRIRADHVSLAARTVRPAAARTPIGQTSGDAAPAHTDHAQELKPATSLSWLNKSVSRGGALRPRSGRPEQRRGAVPAPDAAPPSRGGAGALWRGLARACRSRSSTTSGGGVGTSVGRRRWRRMRSITEASSISAISRKRPPSFDRAQDGPEPRRRSTRLTATLRFSTGRRATARTREDVDPEGAILILHLPQWN